MQINLELLAPAKNKQIGIAAIDCGADSVYIAGPTFGAREAASNSFEDIRDLCDYAHKFGVRIYVTINTILYDEELEDALETIKQVYQAGADAIIIQDLGILRMSGLPPIDLYASTQTNIRTVAQAKFLESLGFKRLILARELSINEISAISEAVDCEIETFVHGALCVSYSGQCYLSQALTGRSANRGNCIQACRSNYDLLDSKGNIIKKDYPILSLKDNNQSENLENLVDAGVTSFKIEGRLKSETYVRNIVRYYRQKLDDLIAKKNSPTILYKKSTLGKIENGFEPNPDAVFNRGFTNYFIDGQRKKMGSGSYSKSKGEYIGSVNKIINNDRCSARFSYYDNQNSSQSHNSIRTNIKPILNGDGLLLFDENDVLIQGIRVDKVDRENVNDENNHNDILITKSIPRLIKGSKIYRNSNPSFGKEILNNSPTRHIPVEVNVSITFDGFNVDASLFDGNIILGEADSITANYTTAIYDEAKNKDKAILNIKAQLSKRTDEFSFQVKDMIIDDGSIIPFFPISKINEIRRVLAISLREKWSMDREDKIEAEQEELSLNKNRSTRKIVAPEQKMKLNCSNKLAKELYNEIGINPELAFELNPKEGFELMRTKYCIRYELGCCLMGKNKRDKNDLNSEWPIENIPSGNMYLRNNGKLLTVKFDCKNCEMVILSCDKIEN
ncbi:MAG: U32 family peptidase [Bacteroidales bacterium]